MEDDPLDDSIVLKPPKPRSAAQIAAFEKAQQKRLANALLKKQALEKAKNDIVVEREKTKKVYKPKAKLEEEPFSINWWKDKLKEITDNNDIIQDFIDFTIKALDLK